jgi:hypothetical protein
MQMHCFLLHHLQIAFAVIFMILIEILMRIQAQKIQFNFFFTPAITQQSLLLFQRKFMHPQVTEIAFLEFPEPRE